ncbi:class I SAM-dependent methyltransferase [Polynucleobacter paneuropaeus]|nr:class I SAM-dependent methyltransferase [Polynucleobacter paneuropaeus]
MNNIDRDLTIEKYREGYQKYGYSPKSLGWDKGRQKIRFEILLSFFECAGKSILDIGCGFGDINQTLSQKTSNAYSYFGIDLVDELINEGRSRYQSDHIRFITADFLEYSFTEKFDIIVASGIFNHKFISEDNDKFVEKVLKKAFSLCTEGVAFDFLSDKVDYCHSHTYHNSPERILGLAYKLSRNICLRNDYMPFEFSIFIGKDDHFNPADAIFNVYKKRISKLS